MNNKAVITKFYHSFSEGNAKGMNECYHKDISFQDPAFGQLKGERAMKMWEMLLSNKNQHLKITFNGIEATNNKGKANWIAEYNFGAKKRKVINKVSAEFEFKDGKIFEHKDSFDLWKWSKQAMGPVGYIIGWTPFMKSKIQSTTNKRLDEFLAKTTRL